jgi:Peptidase C39 family
MINIETGVGGRVYQIWKQQQAASCGVASAWMARGQARQMSFAEVEWDLAQRIYRSAVAGALGASQPSSSGPMSFDPAAFPHDQSSFGSTFSRFGLFTNQMAQALRGERLSTQVYSGGGAAIRIIDSKIAYNKPGIAFVKWNGNGAHFVVIGRCTKHHVTFLDPWSGHIREQTNNGLYSSSYGNNGFIQEVIYISP